MRVGAIPTLLSFPAQLRVWPGQGQVSRRRLTRRLTCCRGAPRRSGAGSPPGRRCSGTYWAGCLWRRHGEGELGARPTCPAHPAQKGTLTSVGAEEGVVGDGPRLRKGVELVKPFPGRVEAQQAGLPHGRQGHHLLPLPHGLLAALPGGGGRVSAAVPRPTAAPHPGLRLEPLAFPPQLTPTPARVPTTTGATKDGPDSTGWVPAFLQ